jgi:GMP synthase (glutamine-hydrolysing)
MPDKIFILDFGSQYTRLIARKVRELNVYCEVYPFNNVPKIDSSVKGIILSGSPFSVRDVDAPVPDLSNIKGYRPLLGICYGAQYIAHTFGGQVAPSKHREYGRAHLKKIDDNDLLFNGVAQNSQVWMSHADTIVSLDDNFKITASTEDVKVGAYKINNENTYGLQFHPEVYHSEDGKKILKNFSDKCVQT